MKKGDKCLTKTNGIHQSTQFTLDGRIVTIDKINNEHEIICVVEFVTGDAFLLPFDSTELIVFPKKNKRDELYLSIPNDILSGTLEEVSKNILDLKDRWLNEVKDPFQKAKKITSFEIEVHADDGFIYLELYGNREETDGEVVERIEQYLKELRWRENVKEEQDKKEYEIFLKLKEKYEKNG
jgi:hypothetical protein